MKHNLDYYNNNAEQFFEHVPQCASILDLGCSSGRDALAFKKMGYQVDATVINP